MINVISLLLVNCICFNTRCNAQRAEPTTWEVTCLKKGKDQYEIHVKVTLDAGWHIYSQKQPADAICEPTKITYSTGKDYKISGEDKEVGKLEIKKDEIIGTTSYQYSNRVEFVKSISYPPTRDMPMNIAVTFQTCNSETCLPPKTLTFEINLSKLGEHYAENSN